MNLLLSCEFNRDTASVELKFDDGTMISIDCTAVEDQIAADLLDEFDRGVQQIARFPYAHELYRTDRPMKDEIRKVPIKNFVLYYAVFPEYVEIRRFLHGRRDRSKGIL